MKKLVSSWTLSGMAVAVVMTFVAMQHLPWHEAVLLAIGFSVICIAVALLRMQIALYAGQRRAELKQPFKLPQTDLSAEEIARPTGAASLQK